MKIFSVVLAILAVSLLTYQTRQLNNQKDVNASLIKEAEFQTALIREGMYRYCLQTVSFMCDSQVDCHTANKYDVINFCESARR